MYERLNSFDSGSQISCEHELTKVEIEVVSKLQKFIEKYYSLLCKQKNNDGWREFQSDKFKLRYTISGDGGVNLIISQINDNSTYVLLQHERTPRYASLDTVCEHSYSNLKIQGDDITLNWIKEIDSFGDKLFQNDNNR